jgi:O-antigen ligase
MRLAPMLLQVGLLLLGLAFLMPGHFMPWVTFQSQAIAALAAGLVALGAAWTARQAGKGLAWPGLAGLALLTACLPPVQWLAGQVSFLSDAVLPALYLLAFALCLVAGAALAAWDRQRWLDGLFTALTVAAMVSVALALVQWTRLGISAVWIAELPPGARPFANLAQPNHLATLLGLGLIGCLRAYERRVFGGWVVALMVAWLLFGLVMTQSRTGWLFLLALSVWFGLMRTRSSLRLRPAPVWAGLVLFAAAVLIWEPLNRALLLAVSAGMGDRMQAGPRTLLWQQFAEAALHAPWFGYGWNQVGLAQQMVAADMPSVGRMAQNAHNVVLDLALWGGIPLALIWLAAVGTWIARRVPACRDLDAWCALAAVGAILLHGMLEYPLDHAYFLLPLGLLMGSLEPAPAAVHRRLRPALTLAVPTLASLAMLGWIGSEYLRLEQANRDLRLLLAGVGIDRVRSVPAPDVSLLDAPREYHRFMHTQARAGMSVAELDWMRAVSQRNPFPPGMLRYALAAGLNGRPAEAGLTLRRLCAMHPAERCKEGREAWGSAQQVHAVLREVPVP